MGLLLRTAGWFKAKAFGLVRRCILAILAAGPVPRHVAFVMDGNRRYARMHRIPVTNGHRDGFAALERVLEIFMRLDIRCVSVYAFSIENFKRDEAEVMALMELAEEKLHQLAAHGALLQKYRIRLNVCGRKELFPIRLQEAIKHVEELTRNHDHAILNLCMPYTSRDEITTAVQNTVREVVDKDIDPE
jgi:ditrans,polycis-polyprenyl diphosphate synthase